ncbi:hypothetical protein DPMN_101513, partial [Dreissena polymorpha]
MKIFSWTLFILCFVLKSCTCSGYFEINVVGIENIRGEVSDGTCCASRDHSRIDGTCVNACKTFFKVCLKEYQSPVRFTGSCTFGHYITEILGNSTFRFDGTSENYGSSIKLPFQFSWTMAYTLIVTAWDKGDIFQGDRLIDVSSHSGVILPGDAWHTLTNNGHTATLIYKIRVVCDTNYFNTTCSKYCRPRDDKLGHYTCNGNGDKVCMDGWLGTECDIAICKPGCHAIHGTCDTPGECKCGYGWRGPLCDECSPYPGCQHGTCRNSPWTCDCDLNWGGILCDKDLNKCRYHPCKNNGLCMNSEPDNYTCHCSLGYAGRNCQI